MEIILKIIAGLTGLFGAFVFLSAILKGFDHKGITLGGLSYLLGGVASFYYVIWWPIVVGIVLALVIRKVYGEPDYNRAPDYVFVLSKEEAKDIEKIGEFILKFLKSDEVGRHILSNQTQIWAESGFLQKFCNETKLADPLTYNLVPWFMNHLRPKIQMLPNYSSQDFRQLASQLNDQSGKYLETAYQIAKKYNLDEKELRSNPSNYMNSLSIEDRTDFSFAIFADNIIHTELRALQYLFSWWNPIQNEG